MDSVALVQKKDSFSWVSLLPGKLLELGLDFVLEMIECRGTGTCCCQPSHLLPDVYRRTTQPILWLVVRDFVDLPVCFVDGSIECWAADQLEQTESACFWEGGTGWRSTYCCNGPRLQRLSVRYVVDLCSWTYLQECKPGRHLGLIIIVSHAIASTPSQSVLSARRCDALCSGGWLKSAGRGGDSGKARSAGRRSTYQHQGPPGSAAPALFLDKIRTNFAMLLLHNYNLKSDYEGSSKNKLGFFMYLSFA